MNEPKTLQFIIYPTSIPFAEDGSLPVDIQSRGSQFQRQTAY